MNRYFYRCPIAVDFMEKYHGITSARIEENKYAILNCDEHLLQPMVGDIIMFDRWINDRKAYPVDFENEPPSYISGTVEGIGINQTWLSIVNGWHSYGRWKRDNPCPFDVRIIMRNNLPWIPPEVEG